METLNMKDNLLALAAETFPRGDTSARRCVPFSPNKPHRERIAYLKALLADTPLDAARQEMAALQKGVDDFVAAHNAAHAQPK